MILLNLFTAAGSDTISITDIARIVLLYTLPEDFKVLRNENEKDPEGTYESAKQSIRGYKKSNAFVET
jgi:hypothetical protein